MENTNDSLSISEEGITRFYYSDLFPYSSIVEWLSYSHPDLANSIPINYHNKYSINPNYLSHREFSLTLRDGIYIRYKSFNSSKNFRDNINKLNPVKIDIGAVYNSSVLLRSRTLSFRPISKEFVIDIDISDYSDVRACCGNEAKICHRCWPFMSCAISLISKTLTEDFGFEKILWIYSGRRGIHCWVCDERARKMSDKVRESIAEYLRIYRGNEFNVGDCRFKMLGEEKKEVGELNKRVYEICEKYFEILFLNKIFFLYNKKLRNLLTKILKVKFYYSEKVLEKFFSDIESENFGEEIYGLEEEKNYSREYEKHKKLWLALKEHIMENDNFYKQHNISRCLFTIYVSFVYPRLDIEVSKKMGHLLKSPFSMHPSTFNICIPIPIEKVEDFDVIKNCPNAKRIYEEEVKNKKIKGRKDKKELEKAIRYFNQKFLGMLLNDAKVKISQIKEESGLI